MTTKSVETLEHFLTKELEMNKIQIELQEKRMNQTKELVKSIFENGDEILLVITTKELSILKSGLVAQKKLMRGKIRNNERHALAGDRPAWTDKDFDKAIKKRKVQLADADMLKTRLENL